MADYTQYIKESVPEFVTGLGLGISWIIVILVIIIISGMALWKAAKLNEKVWFWVMIVVNSMGILPLIYLILKRNKKVKF